MSVMLGISQKIASGSRIAALSSLPHSLGHSDRSLCPLLRANPIIFLHMVLTQCSDLKYSLSVYLPVIVLNEFKLWLNSSL